MTKAVRNFAVLVLLIVAGTSFAEGVLWKINDKGQKVFYNNPPKVRPEASSSNGKDITLVYSKKFEQYSKLISTICERHGVAPQLVKAVIQESRRQWKWRRSQ